MESDPFISQLLIKRGAYTDLDKPVIFTSGEVGIFYINTQNLVGDQGAWKNYGKNAKKMIEHAVQRAEEDPEFAQVINILAARVRNAEISVEAISGGQRRDWLFSGPVARQLHLPHVSLYKQDDGEDKVEMLHTDGRVTTALPSDLRVVHVCDLLTKGSSGYRVEQGKVKGWIPMLRARNADVHNLVTVVSRLQGGEENLADRGVMVDALAYINEDFLRNHSHNPERAIAYIQDPQAWSTQYLQQHGALGFLPAFNPEGDELPRAKRFLEKYQGVLTEAGKMRELEQAIEQTYSRSLRDILGGR